MKIFISLVILIFGFVVYFQGYDNGKTEGYEEGYAEAKYYYEDREQDYKNCIEQYSNIIYTAEDYFELGMFTNGMDELSWKPFCP